MSTATSTATPINDTDANFRLWGQAVAAAFVSAGLVKTTDTGQINWASVVKPASTSTYQGYEIYKFNDSLQATAPIFLKVEYGSGGNSATAVALRLTVSTATTGAGNLTTSPAVYAGTFTSDSFGFGYSSIAQNIYVCAETNGFALVLFPYGGSANGAAPYVGPSMLSLVVERWRNADGTANGEGFTVMFYGSGAPATTTYHVRASMSAGSVASAAGTAMHANNLTGTSLSEGSDVGLIPIFPFAPRIRPPLKLAFHYYTGGGSVLANIVYMSTFSMTTYGAARTYKAFGRAFPFSSSGCGTALLWE